MSKKENLLKKLIQKPKPTNFTTRELDTLMKNYGCKKIEGGAEDRVLDICMKLLNV